MKYTAGAVYDAIDALAPFGSCMEWDNVGLLVGSPEAAAGRLDLRSSCTESPVIGESTRAKRKGELP